MKPLQINQRSTWIIGPICTSGKISESLTNQIALLRLVEVRITLVSVFHQLKLSNNVQIQCESLVKAQFCKIKLNLSVIFKCTHSAIKHHTTSCSFCVVRGSDVKVPVLFIESTLQHQLLKVDERHRDGDGLHAAILPNHSHLSLQTARQKQILIWLNSLL